MERYESFKEYLHKMHEEAVNILKRTGEPILELFERTPQKEHYWTAKKLFCHAMYIPMFLIIGRKHFQKLIYIDTHAGPGIAKIGEGEKEIILGSPLIAIKWPKIIADSIQSFSGIRDGFDEICLIEKDLSISSILSHVVEEVGIDEQIALYKGDCNILLPKIVEKIHENYSSRRVKTLLYVFIDPYGHLDNQITYEALWLLASNVNADIMMNVMALSIARGLSSLAGEDRRKFIVKMFSTQNLEKIPSLVMNENISCKDIIDAYKITMESLGYKKVEFIPVEFERGTLYHLMIAVKGSGKWIDGFVNYIKNKAPKDYDTLKQLFLQAIGKQKSITEIY